MDPSVSQATLDAFRSFDPEGTGKISKEDLLLLFKAINADEKILKEANGLLDGSVDYSAFLQWLYAPSGRETKESFKDNSLALDQPSAPPIADVRFSQPSYDLSQLFDGDLPNSVGVTAEWEAAILRAAATAEVHQPAWTHIDMVETDLPDVVPTKSDVMVSLEAYSQPKDVVGSMSKPPRQTARKSALKKDRIMLASDQQMQEMMAGKTRLQRFTTSRTYELSSGFLIMLNSGFIGFTTQYEANSHAELAAENLSQDLFQKPLAFLAIQVAFTVIFVAELALRMVAEGLCTFFQRGEDLSWNVFDIVVVFISVVDCILELINKMTQTDEMGLGNVSVLRVLRVVRVVRVVRIIRVMRFFRELRMMVYSTIGCLKSLTWITMIFGIIFYIFGIAFTSATLDYLETTEMWRSEENQPLISTFGNVQSAVLSLYLSISGGEDWGIYYFSLTRTGGIQGFLFIIYMCFTFFAVINVVTGVFVDTAMQVGKEDREVMLHEQMEQKKQYHATLELFFRALDKDDSGYMDREEFLQILSEEKVAAFFKALKLDTRHANQLFDLLDADMSGQIDTEEFIDGCWQLMGEPSALDAKIMHAEVRFVKDMIKQVSAEVHTLSQVVKELKQART
mmetsp:Transcript_98377/g.175155  ORF Transcript_98377/g.175155 Transcript_98377/m.175155 type:complete len:623 (+) Transcript_98377:74-1942(+)